MSDDPVAADLKEFITTAIDSVAHLEALLLLRSDSTRAWDTISIAKRLYTSERQAAEILDGLCEQGLLTRESEAYRYTRQPPELLALVDRLANAYAKHLIAVTNTIHGKPRRIRQFSDAFKFRRDS